MRPKPIVQTGPFEPFDERDSVFARTRLIPGTDFYNEYYKHRPENQSTDDKTRNLNNLASPGTRRYSPLEAALIEAQFSASDLIASAVEQTVSLNSTIPPDGLGLAVAEEEDDEENNGPRHILSDVSPASITKLVKETALFLGADDVGIAPLDHGFVYSHRARPTRCFGDVVDLQHSHAIVLVFVMRNPYILACPEMVSTAEVARVYQKLSFASFALADALSRLGFEARAHVDSNYLVICPPLAVEAGLGEIGRNGILVHHTYGPAVRIGVVTLNAELKRDNPGCWGIADFCRICGKCAINCPSKAIPDGELDQVRGANKWPIIPERCYHYWRTQGTDCGLCVRTCPFSKSNTPLHRFVRSTVSTTTTFNRFLLWADDLLYGAKPKPKQPPLLSINKDADTE
ncbi:MAG: 4Fe-4S dicluster domain-containing protein [Proteobacteria bacterium]|nr:4Fe-4S dicluster domain-containing protein [Pseudomonadota bacterium]